MHHVLVPRYELLPINTTTQYVRRDRHERLHPSVLEDRKQHNKPERHREVPDGADVEPAALDVPGVPHAVRLVRDVVARTEVAVEEEDGHRAAEREERDGGADPQRPGVRTQVLGDNVRRRLARELREVRDTPTPASALVHPSHELSAHHMVPMENAKPLPGAKYVEKIRCWALSSEPSPIAARTLPMMSSG